MSQSKAKGYVYSKQYKMFKKHFSNNYSIFGLETPMTPGYIIDNVSKCITRCIIKTLIFGQQDESAYLHSLSLVRSCTQKAVSLLRDSVIKASRSMVRMHTLLGLLEKDVGHNGGQLIHWHNLLIYYLKYWEVRHKKNLSFNIILCISTLPGNIA